MKVIHLRVVVADEIEADDIIQLLGAEGEHKVHGACDLNSDGFGRLSADMNGARIFVYATEDEHMTVHHGLSHGTL